MALRRNAWGPRRLFALLGLAAAGLGIGAGAAPGEDRVELRPVRSPDGGTIELKAPEGGVSALVVYSSECPISNAYSPTLNALAEEFGRSKLNLVGLCVDPDLADDALVAHAREYKLTFPVAADRRGRVARRLGVKVTPEAVVVDREGRVRYRGRIDDQFAARQKRNANPKTHELRDAIAAVLAGREVERAEVKAVGCPLPEVAEAEDREHVTYAEDVAAILQKRCLSCHRPGQVGPFALGTFEQARKRAGDIAAVAEGRTMPPWKPAPGFGPKFKYDKSLTEGEIATLAAWAESGAPQGDPAMAPRYAAPDDDWTFGTPDLILEPDEDFEIPASGDDIYRCFVIPTNLGEDKYIEAIEYRPGNRRVVHHVLSYTETQGQARKRDEADPGPGYSCFSGPGVQIAGDLGGWAPGNEASRLPEGIGRRLPRGADVVMQVHYHPGGKPEKDRTRMGIYFARKPVKQTFHWNAAVGVNEIPESAKTAEDKRRPPLFLPAGDSNREAAGTWEVPVDVVALAVTPHMHMLGRDMTMTAELPDGRTIDLIRIDDWNFNWQNTYYFEDPIDLPRGTKVKVVAHFDNSEGNPRNPNRPPKDVKWGEATTDEMCIGFLGVVKKGQDLTRGDADDLREIFEKQRRPGTHRDRPDAKQAGGD